MLFYYVQDVYKKNQLGTRLDKKIKDYDTREEGGGTILLGNDINNVIAHEVLFFIKVLSRAYCRNLGQRLILARKGTFLRKKGTKTFIPPIQALL